MRFLLVICLATALTYVTQASECTTRLHGVCIPGDFNGCPEGYNRYSLSYCGFQATCCYNNYTVTTTTAPSSHITSQTCGISAVNDAHRIVGGHTAQPGEYPWQVSVRYNNYHICGGTVIDRQWILTASHCFDDASLSTYHWTVAAGIFDRDHIPSSRVYHVSGIYRHRNYDVDTNHNDIALMRLTYPLDITSHDIRAACLPDSDETFQGVMCTVTGWGATDHVDGTGSRYLMEADIPVMSNSLCHYYLGSEAQINDGNICAGLSRGGRDTCQGDSGGPLMCKTGGVWKVAGVVSWGYGCGDVYTPGVYTRVTYYKNWIRSITGSSSLIG